MDKQAILNGATFTLDTESGDKFHLTFTRSWNNYGFYTIYDIWIKPKGSGLTYRLGWLHIMNLGQKTGETPVWIPTPPMTFISSVEVAENIFMMLSPNQRRQFESLFNVRYDCEIVKDELVFQKSVNRDKTLDDFKNRQTRIKEFVKSSINMRDIVERHKEQWGNFISDLPI